MLAVIALGIPGSASAAAGEERSMPVETLADRLPAGAVTSSGAVHTHQPAADSRSRCPSVQRAIKFYSRRVAYWRDKIGHPSNVPGSKVQRAQSGGCPRYLAHALQRKAYGLRRAYARWLERVTNDAILAIRFVFGPYAVQALVVADCESGLSRHAQNGQYLGIFQMGSYARSRYGHGETFLAQARSAHSYFVASGRDWSPWSCKP